MFELLNPSTFGAAVCHPNTITGITCSSIGACRPNSDPSTEQHPDRAHFTFSISVFGDPPTGLSNMDAHLPPATAIACLVNSDQGIPLCLWPSVCLSISACFAAYAAVPQPQPRAAYPVVTLTCFSTVSISWRSTCQSYKEKLHSPPMLIV